jgi:hypothetical protein
MYSILESKLMSFDSSIKINELKNNVWMVFEYLHSLSSVGTMKTPTLEQFLQV